MSDELDEAVGEFLRQYKQAMKDYDRGYVDADATLSLIGSKVEELREAREN
ncbi:hypothetical protein ACFQJC_08190 [Haloferax namakaokahaiae]|uniref:Uncharacterized protein n=1 Tax=Haloferax namakaokahaiae TaxID=1748331 RepID=A0ABD5ZED9_9EURY